MRVSAYGHAQRQYEAASRLAPAIGPGATALAAQARVTTKSIGFQLGGFGVTYTSKRLDLDPDNLAKAAAEFRERTYQRLLDSCCDVETVGAELAASGGSAQGEAGPGQAAADPAQRKRGLAAYARAVLAADPAPRMLAAVV
jgi:hypothetical protein